MYIVVVYIVAFWVNYLVGSIPFGVMLTRLAGAPDVRTIGSGNIGATNVLRTGRKWLALLTLLLDTGKGWLGGWLAECVGYMAIIHAPAGYTITSHMLSVLIVSGCAGVLVGHVFPVWLKFKGGKGVATALGILFALYYPCALFTIGIWLLVFGVSRISSLSSIIAAVGASLFMLYYNIPFYGLLVSGISLFVIFRHHSNIKRLLNGTEPRFGRS